MCVCVCVLRDRSKFVEIVECFYAVAFAGKHTDTANTRKTEPSSTNI